MMSFSCYECNDPIRTRCTSMSTSTRSVRVYLYINIVLKDTVFDFDYLIN